MTRRIELQTTSVHSIPRYIAGTAGALMLSVGAFFAASYVDRGVGIVVGVAIFIATFGAVIAQASKPKLVAIALLRELEIFAAIAAIGLPLAVYLFSHLTTARYVSVIALGGLCAHLGSAAVLFSGALVAILIGVGATGMYLSDASASRIPISGALAGSTLSLIAVIAAIAAPDVAAAVLGCR